MLSGSSCGRLGVPILTARLPAATLYLGVMILLLFIIGSSLTDLLDKHAAVAASATMLEQFEGRRPVAIRGQAAGDKQFRSDHDIVDRKHAGGSFKTGC